MSRLKPQQADSLRAGGKNNRKKHYKVKQSQTNGTQQLNGLRADEIRVVHLAASCFSSFFFQMPTTAMQNVCPPKMSNIFSTLGCDCDLKIYCLLSRKISTSDSASSWWWQFYEYFWEPWQEFSLKMKLLSDAMSCIAIDVVNNILVYTEHQNPLMTREGSLGRRVTQRNRKGPLESSHLLACQPFIMAGKTRHKQWLSRWLKQNKWINLMKYDPLPHKDLKDQHCASIKLFSLSLLLFQSSAKSQCRRELNNPTATLRPILWY